MVHFSEFGSIECCSKITITAIRMALSVFLLVSGVLGVVLVIQLGGMQMFLLVVMRIWLLLLKRHMLL